MTDDQPETATAWAPTKDDAAEYADTNPVNPVVDEYVWPALRSLLPEVSGRRILDAGCGTGNHTAKLSDDAESVIGIDANREMLEVARERFGDAADFHYADLNDPLDFDDDAFDIIVSQLVLSHIQDWRSVFDEFHRVLTSGGQVVFITDHPFLGYWAVEHRGSDSVDVDSINYFEGKRYHKEVSGSSIPGYWRPLQDMINPVLESGLTLERVLEPEPPNHWEEEKRYDLPRFIGFRAGKPPGGKTVDGA